ncbi:MAG: FKBP-type peptidyl-prolyl cis-trans isomerase [Longimicrobiales bacterium]
MRLLLTVLVLFAACDSPSEPDDRWAVPEDITFAASLGIDLAAMNQTESGLYWQDITMGQEQSRSVIVEDEVRLHYTIWLPDGRSVETTRGGTPFQSDVRLLIAGVAEGIIGMKPGGIRRLVIRPELAWPSGHGPIPPITTIVFEIELIAIVD